MKHVACSWIVVGLLGLAACQTTWGQSTSSAQDEFFEKEVRPILVERCQKCHGDEKPKSGLRLTSRETILQGGDSGPAAVAGQPEESLLVQAIRHEDEPRMPPKQKLPEPEIAALSRWVAMGLPWPKRDQPAATARLDRSFWSFQPIKSVPPPAVKDLAWCKSDIDRFILARLEAEHLSPSAQADRRTLIRRATFDVIGLPPTPEEIEAFLADGSPQAFAKVIDRLLASPHYGERWGRHWLDVVRYADSRDARGIGGDSDITEAYRYRDWVINAFNRDLPFDQFVMQQVAGDLLPGSGPNGFNAEGLIATGLLAIGEWGTGDADKEKMLTDIVDDQIDVVGRAFLGLTLACARCHDHKFDPIPTEDYYGLAGIFFSSKILPDPGAKTAGSPLLRTPIVPPEVVAAAKNHENRTKDLEARLKALTEQHARAFAERVVPETTRYLTAAWEYHRERTSPDASITEHAAERGLDARILLQWLDFLGWGTGRHMNQMVRAVSGKPGVLLWRGAADCPNLVLNTTAQEIAIATFKLAPRSVSIHPGPKSAVAVAWQSPISGIVRIEGLVADADPVAGDGVAWRLRLTGHEKHELASGMLANGGSRSIPAIPRVAVEPGDRIELIVDPRSSHTCDTTRIELTIHPVEGNESWSLASDLLADPPGANPRSDRFGHDATWHFLDLDATSPPVLADDGPLARWYRRASADAEENELAAVLGEVRQALDAPDSKLRKALLSPGGPLWIAPTLADSYLSEPAREELRVIAHELDQLRQNPPPAIPVALAVQEGGVPKSAHEGFHDARIHLRGSYQRLGRLVPRHFPRVVAGDDQPPISEGSGRLELARWLARKDNPLLARVMVNRIWQHHFGEGIVRTPSNFGKLGEGPTHPELLDWLASEFIASGWSIKAMHRAIMLSAAYQQSSHASAEALRTDPDNRLFSRMNRRRLEAEAIRDSLLAVCGQLDRTMSGPAFRELATPRRTVYLMTIRSDRSSFGPLFDAADPAAIVDRRTVSTVAPQALFLLNDPFALEQARALARRIEKDVPGDARRQVERLYELVYGKLPSEDERAIGERALTGIGLKDALAAYCQVLLCADEFVFID